MSVCSPVLIEHFWKDLGVGPCSALGWRGVGRLSAWQHPACHQPPKMICTTSLTENIYRKRNLLSLCEFIILLVIQDGRNGAENNFFICTYIPQPVRPKGNQTWVLIGRTDAEAEALVLWPPDAKSWLIGKDPDAGKDWGWEEKKVAKGEMVG